MVRCNHITQIQTSRQRVGKILEEIDSLDLASAPHLRVAILAERWQVMATCFSDQLFAVSQAIQVAEGNKEISS